MRYLLICFLLFLAINAMAQGTLTPYRLAITVKNVEAASAWYKDKLDFKTYKKMSFPEYDSLKIYFLKKDGFEIELIEKKTSISIKNYVPDYDMNKNPLQGFAKIAFKVEKINEFYERMKKKGVKEILGVTHDNTFNSYFFMIEDPDGNLLQFIEPVKNQ